MVLRAAIPAPPATVLETHNLGSKSYPCGPFSFLFVSAFFPVLPAVYLYVHFSMFSVDNKKFKMNSRCNCVSCVRLGSSDAGQRLWRRLRPPLRGCRNRPQAMRTRSARGVLPPPTPTKPRLIFPSAGPRLAAREAPTGSVTAATGLPRKPGLTDS